MASSAKRPEAQRGWRERSDFEPDGENVKTNVRAAPPYAVVLLSAPDHGRPPDVMDGKVIAATEDCVAIGCQSDGDTEFVLGDLLSVGQDGTPAFRGRLRVDGVVALQTVEGVTLLEHAVPTEWVNVWIWLNHPSEPDLVVVGVDGPSNHTE